MTIDETIKHCEELADQLEGKDGYAYTDSTCDECAKEHRQLAEWLRELQIYRKKLTEIEEAVDFYKGCESCQGFREYPTDKFVEDLVRILEVNADEDSN